MMFVAPIIHARTKNYDFPSNLLAVPDDFSAADVSWARKYILGSTRYFELSGEKGRRVIFCNAEIMVSGISIRIGDLYRACNQEPKYEWVDGKRTNYAFIGIAVHKNELSDMVEISLEYLLKIYEHYMEMLWDKAFEEKGLEAVKTSYEPQEFPTVEEKYTIPVVDKKGSKLVIDESFAPLDSVIAAITRQMCSLSEYAFCSNMPNATSVLDSDFSVVTSPNARGIIEVMKRREEKARLEEKERTERREKKEGTGKREEREKGEGRETGEREENAEEAGYRKERGNPEEVMDFYRRKKMKWAEVLKKGEALKRNQEQKEYQVFCKKSLKVKRDEEVNQENQDMGKKIREIHQESQELNQELKERKAENKKAMKKVLGGVLLFFSTICVLISVKNEEQDSSLE